MSGARTASIQRLPAPPVIDVAALGRGSATREIPSYKFGRSRRIRLADLEDWASERKEV
jgi:hypothetical protein